LNIEADAELGMPIDLVGLPGVFDGDESGRETMPDHVFIAYFPIAIQAMDKAPALSNADRLLLRAPNALGKPVSGASGISFLRRTEYTTSYTTGGSKFESSNSSNTMRVKGKRRRPADLSQDDPINIAKHIQKGFDIAYPEDAYQGADTPDELRAVEASAEERKAWKLPRHPTKGSQVTALDEYPILPDWDALPDSGAYMMFKFGAPPLKDADSRYDERLDVALLRPAGQSVEDSERYITESAAQKADPTRPVPLPWYHFEYFLPADKEKVQGIKRNFTTFDPDNEDEIPFDAGVDYEGRPRKQFKYENIRLYETANQQSNPNDPFADVVAMALHDGEPEKKVDANGNVIKDEKGHQGPRYRSKPLAKGAYIYPISQRTVIRPKRPGKAEMVGGEQQRVDVIETVARDPAIEIERREVFRKRYDVATEG
jgi:RNA polymerase II-associated factor 1